MSATPCDHIADHLRELYTCSQQGEYIRVRTPLLYPDGDVVDVYVHSQNGGGTVSDLGETTAWLRTQSTASRRSPKQTRLIEDVCLTLDVEFFKGMLCARYDNNEAMVAAIERVSQSAVRVSDLWFTFRTRSVQSVTDEVAEYLSDRRIPYQRGERLPGRLGGMWTVDFHARTPQRTSFVQVLTTGNRSAAQRLAEHVLASWYDLSHYKVGAEGVRFVSLFDDTSDVWSEEQLQLVGDLSDIAYWSRPDEFADVLTAVA